MLPENTAKLAHNLNKFSSQTAIKCEDTRTILSRSLLKKFTWLYLLIISETREQELSYIRFIVDSILSEVAELQLIILFKKDFITNFFSLRLRIWKAIFQESLGYLVLETFTTNISEKTLLVSSIYIEGTKTKLFLLIVCWIYSM